MLRTTSARIRAEVAASLIVQAEADGTTYLAAVESEAAARVRLDQAGRLGRRKARNGHRVATEHTQAVRARLREAWGEPPRTADVLPEWAARQAQQRADADPRVIDAAQHVEAVRADREAMRRRHEQERRVLLVSEYAADQARATVRVRLTNPRRLAHHARSHAAAARAQADELRSLPVNEAAARITDQRAERQRQQAVER